MRRAMYFVVERFGDVVALPEAVDHPPQRADVAVVLMRRDPSVFLSSSMILSSRDGAGGRSLVSQGAASSSAADVYLLVLEAFQCLRFSEIV